MSYSHKLLFLAMSKRFTRISSPNFIHTITNYNHIEHSRVLYSNDKQQASPNNQSYKLVLALLFFNKVDRFMAISLSVDILIATTMVFWVQSFWACMLFVAVLWMPRTCSISLNLGLRLGLGIGWLEGLQWWVGLILPCCFTLRCWVVVFLPITILFLVW